MQDREQLKRMLSDSLTVMLRAKREELARRGRTVTEAELILWCRNLLKPMAAAAAAKARLFVSDEELALRRELLEEILAERKGDS